MADTKDDPRLLPEEAETVERQKGERPTQPYASELDAQELQRAHKEKRPVAPKPDPNA